VSVENRTDQDRDAEVGEGRRADQGKGAPLVLLLAVEHKRLARLEGVELAVTNASNGPLRARLGLEWATTMLGGGGNPSAWWEIGEQRAGHDGSGAGAGIERLAQGNDWLGIRIDTRISPACDAWWAPIETVSNSEEGFERVYQGSALLLSWVVDLEPGQQWLGSVEHRVATERDRGAKLVAPKTPSARGLRATG